MPRWRCGIGRIPPTIGITAPNPRLDLEDGAFRLCVEAQPWLHADVDHPRRAGVSAFGFGGTNFHAVLEAYERDPVATPGRCRLATGRPSCLPGRPPVATDCFATSIACAERLAAGARPPLRDLAHTLAARRGHARDGPNPGDRRRPRTTT